MTNLVDLNAMDLINLRRFYKKSPKQFERSIVNLLNTFAFETRKDALRVIHSELNIRNQSFVVSRMRVKTANLSTMKSEVGSIRTARFSGWEEQETGKKTKRTRIATAIGRGGSEKGQIRPMNRLKPGKDFPDPNDYDADTAEHRVIAMLRALKKEKYRKPFIIKGHKKFKSGMYKYHRGKVKRVQEFKAKNAQPKRVKWMTQARRNMFAKNNIRKMWANSIKRTVKFRR